MILTRLVDVTVRLHHGHAFRIGGRDIHCKCGPCLILELIDTHDRRDPVTQC